MENRKTTYWILWTQVIIIDKVNPNIRVAVEKTKWLNNADNTRISNFAAVSYTATAPQLALLFFLVDNKIYIELNYCLYKNNGPHNESHCKIWNTFNDEEYNTIMVHKVNMWG